MAAEATGSPDRTSLAPTNANIGSRIGPRGEHRQAVSGLDDDVLAVGKRAEDHLIAATHLGKRRLVDLLHVLDERDNSGRSAGSSG